MIKALLAAVAAASLTTTLPVLADQAKEKVVEAGVVRETASIKATVQSVDLDQRIVTLKGSDGKVFDLKVGPEARFVSRNDNISLSLYDNGAVRAGIVGKLIWSRDSSDHAALNGVHDVKFGGEAGVFAEVYPTDWLRVRGEVRHGIRSHDGVVADVSADAFHDITEKVRISGGPRLSAATEGYYDAFYGVNAAEAAASGLTAYNPTSGGLKSIGVGGAVTWKTTDNVTTSLFGEYARLQGPAARSSIVRERGSRDQFTVGVSATYRFNFTF